MSLPESWAPMDMQPQSMLQLVCIVTGPFPLYMIHQGNDKLDHHSIWVLRLTLLHNVGYEHDIGLPDGLILLPNASPVNSGPLLLCLL